MSVDDARASSTTSLKRKAVCFMLCSTTKWLAPTAIHERCIETYSKFYFNLCGLNDPFNCQYQLVLFKKNTFFSPFIYFSSCLNFIKHCWPPFSFNCLTSSLYSTMSTLVQVQAIIANNCQPKLDKDLKSAVTQIAVTVILSGLVCLQSFADNEPRNNRDNIDSLTLLYMVSLYN